MTRHSLPHRITAIAALAALVVAVGAGCPNDSTSAGGGVSGFAITTDVIPDAVSNQTYRVLLAAAGGNIGHTYTWSVTSGALPAGVVLADTHEPIAALFGVPEVQGRFDFTVRAADGHGRVASRSYTLMVDGNFAITTTQLPRGVVGFAYNRAIVADGGSNAGYNWEVVSGSLPPGMNLQSGTPEARVVGTPSVEGKSAFTVGVVDSKGNMAKRRAFLIEVNPPIQIETPPDLPYGFVGRSYDTYLEARDGTGTGYTWSLVSGALPAGLDLIDGPDARITGTPTTPGRAVFTARVTDSGNSSIDRTFTIDVYTVPEIVTGGLPLGVTGVAYDQSIVGTGGEGSSYTWTVEAGELPPGLTLTPGTPNAQVAGTPSSAGSKGFTLRLTDDVTGEWDEVTLILAIYDPLVIETTSLPRFLENVYAEVELTASGGSGEDYAWTVESGALPTGMSITDATPTSTLDGTPVGFGSYPVILRVTDSVGITADWSVTIYVDPALQVLTTTLPAGYVDDSYSQPISAIGGTGSGYSFEVTAGRLPYGLTITDGTPSATLSGTPLTMETQTFTVKVTDSFGNTADRELTLQILAPSTVAINTPFLDAVFFGDTFNLTVETVGGSGSGYVWSVSNGSLPTGVNLTGGSPNATLTGAISESGSYTFTLKVVDGIYSAEREFTIFVKQRYLAYSGDFEVYGRENIYLYDLKTQTRKVIDSQDTGTSYSNSYIQWSPNGRWLAYRVYNSSTGSPYYKVYAIDVTATNPTPIRITPTTVGYTSATVYAIQWSGDSDKLFYVSNQNSSGLYELFMVRGFNSGTISQQYRVSHNTTNTSYDVYTSFYGDDYWNRMQYGSMASPDGRWMAWKSYYGNTSSQYNCYVSYVGGTGAPGAPIMVNPTLPSTSADVDCFTWSPDGSKLIVMGDMWTYAETEIGSVYMGGTTPATMQRVTWSGMNGYVRYSSYQQQAVRWRPGSNSMQFAFIGSRYSSDGDNVWLVTYSGTTAGTPQRIGSLPPSSSYDAETYDWSPDGKWMAIRADWDRSSYYDLYVVDMSSGIGTPKRVTETSITGDVYYWYGTYPSFMFSPDSTKLVYKADLTSLNKFDAYFVDLSTGTPGPQTRVTNTPTNTNYYAYAIRPSNEGTLVTGDLRTDGKNESWFIRYDEAPADITTNTASHRNMPSYGDVYYSSYYGSYLTRNGIYWAYRAYQTYSGAYELYLADLTGNDPVAVNISGSPPSSSADIDWFAFHIW
jgi:hypothetical protein